MKLRIALMLALACAALGPTVSQAQDNVRTVNVRFESGASGTTIKDRVKGYDTVLFKLGANAGQTMQITMTTDNSSSYFNVYAPGQGLGGEALAVSEIVGPMVPDINRFDGALPTSGEYSVAVYLYRNAARRGETANFTLDIGIDGGTGGVIQGDFADGLAGGPDFFEVRTTGGGTLNLRSDASSGARIISKLSRGTVVRNLGCKIAEGGRWCNVATLADPGYEGWASGDFLIEGSDPAMGGVATQLPEPVPVESYDALVPGTNFNATGPIDCIRGDAPQTTCTFGVVRRGNGSADLTLTWPDGTTRLIFFENGAPESYDFSQADGDQQMTSLLQGDIFNITIGREQYFVPEAAVFGG